MSRTNFYLLVGVIVLLAAAMLGGQLEFQRTHSAGVAGLPPGHPAVGGAGAAGGMAAPGAAPATGPQAGPGVTAADGQLTMADLDQGPGPNDDKPFPAELNGLPRTEHLTGAEAVAAVNKLHGKEITAESAEIATYSRGGEKVIVWKSASASPAEAQALMQQMVDRMQTGDGPYTKPELLNIKNKAYFTSTGNGMHHYFYLRGRHLYWVAVQAPMDKIMGVMSFIVNQL